MIRNVARNIKYKISENTGKVQNIKKLNL